MNFPVSALGTFIFGRGIIALIVGLDAATKGALPFSRPN
jgi:hypothetical protein